MEAVVPAMQELSMYLAVFTELSVEDLVSIEKISKDRIACICKVDSDLMHSSCANFYFYQ